MLLVAKHLQCTRSEKLYRSGEPDSCGGWVPSAELGGRPRLGSSQNGAGGAGPLGQDTTAV